MSASMLTRLVAPWMVGPCQWTPNLIRKAVVWLCQKVHKPILKLKQQDYFENSLGELIELYGLTEGIITTHAVSPAKTSRPSQPGA